MKRSIHFRAVWIFASFIVTSRKSLVALAGGTRLVERLEREQNTRRETTEFYPKNRRPRSQTEHSSMDEVFQGFLRLSHTPVQQ
jgi:hypothetical protein